MGVSDKYLSFCGVTTIQVDLSTLTRGREMHVLLHSCRWTKETRHHRNSVGNESHMKLAKKFPALENVQKYFCHFPALENIKKYFLFCITIKTKHYKIYLFKIHREQDNTADSIRKTV